MYNLRYHIASLAAVFLALAVGLVLGSIVIERGTLDRQQTQMVEGLQKQFDRLTEENRQLRAVSDAHERFATDLAKGVATDRLRGRRVLVISSPSRKADAALVARAVEDAGGVAVAISVRDAGFGLAQPRVSSVASEALGPIDDDLADAVIRALAIDLAAGSAETSITVALRDVGVLKTEATPSGGTPTGAVFLTDWDGKTDDASLAVAKLMGESGVIVIGAQGLEAESDVAARFAAAGFGAVSGVDSPEGSYSLTLLLAGEVTGHYGIGQGADEVYPPLASE